MSQQAHNSIGEVMNSRAATVNRAATLWLANVSAAFAFVYWLMNHLTSLRSDVGAAVFAWERAIPFIEWTIVPHGSIVAFFAVSFFLCRTDAELKSHAARLAAVMLISVICYLLWPQRCRSSIQPCAVTAHQRAGHPVGVVHAPSARLEKTRCTAGSR